MRQRLPLVLSLTAIVVAVLGATSVGQAATKAARQTARAAGHTIGLGPAKAQPLRGPRGPRGKRGPRGPAGPAGIAALTALDGPAVPQCAYGSGGCEVASSTATCPAGTYVVGGGFQGSTPGDTIVYARRVSTSAYGVIAVNFWDTPATISAQAICAGGQGIQPSGLQVSAAEFKAKLAELRAQLAR
jgi:hypothetical protein